MFARQHALLRTACTLGVLLCLLAQAAVVQADPPDPTYGNLLRQGHAFLQQAQRAYLRGDTKSQRAYAERAEQFFLRAAQQPRRDLRAFLMGGQAAAFAGNMKSCEQWIELYRRSTPYGDRDPDLAYLRAFVGYFGGGSAEVAIQHLKRMHAINPRVRPLERDTLWYSALMDRAGEHIVRGDYHLAIRDYREAARLSRMHRWEAKRQAALGSAGISLRLATRYAEAHEIFDALLKSNPESALWHWHKGLVHAEEHEFQKAIASYRKVIALRAAGKATPSTMANTEAVDLRLANCIRNITRPDLPRARREVLMAEAQKHLEIYVRRVPKDANGHKWLGTFLYEDRERPLEALPHFQRAYELDPMCSAPLRYLVQIHTRHPPEQQEGESEAAYDKRALAWDKKRLALAKDLEDGVEKRAEEMENRERKRGKNNTGCE